MNGPAMNAPTNQPNMFGNMLYGLILLFVARRSTLKPICAAFGGRSRLGQNREASLVSRPPGHVAAAAGPAFCKRR